MRRKIIRRGLVWCTFLFPLVFAACPRQRSQEDQQSTMPAAGATARQPVMRSFSYPEPALELVSAALAGSDAPEYGQALGFISLLRSVKAASNGARLREQVLTLVAKEETPGPSEISAWLALDPDSALMLASRQLSEGNFTVLSALWQHPVSGRRLMAELDITTLDSTEQYRLLRIIQAWSPGPEDETLLMDMAARGSEAAALAATGLLLRLRPGDETLREQLWEAARGDKSRRSSVAEAIRLSHDAELAAALVPWVAAGDSAAATVTPTAELHAAYALTQLPGGQATLMRTRLLETGTPAVQWQARLGQLLRGDDPEPWNSAVAEAGLASTDIWVALEPRDAIHPALLNTYSRAAADGDERVRALAALHLNRYGGDESQDTVEQLLAALVADEADTVAAVAWQTAARLRLTGLTPRALETMADTEAGAGRRLAAAGYALVAAEALAISGEDS